MPDESRVTPTDPEQAAARVRATVAKMENVPDGAETMLIPASQSAAFADDLRALLAERDRLREDKARLDWLAVRYTDYDRWLGVYYADYGFADLRQALDAARAAATPSEGTDGRDEG